MGLESFRNSCHVYTTSIHIFVMAVFDFIMSFVILM